MSRRDIPTIQEADGEELKKLKQMIIDDHLNDLEKFENYIYKMTTKALEYLEIPLEEYRAQKHNQYITQDEMDAFKLMFAVNAIKLMREEAKKER